MAYRNQYDAAFAGADLEQRVTLSIVARALAIYGEDPGTTGHAKRAELATRILNAPESFVRPFLFVAAIGASQNDAGVDSSVGAAWNAVAGV